MAICSSVAYSVLGGVVYPVVSGYEPNDFELDIVSRKSGHTVMPGDEDRPRVRLGALRREMGSSVVIL